MLSGADGGLFRQFRPASRNLAGSICTPRFLYQSTKSVEIVHHNILYICNIISRRRKCGETVDSLAYCFHVFRGCGYF